MRIRQAGRRITTAAAVKQKAVYRSGRRQTGKGNAMSDGERFRLIRLVICGSVFVLLVAAKLLLPGKMADFNRKLSETMSRNIDVQAVFSAVGDLFTGGGTPSVTADEVYQAVFHPEAAAQKTVASTGGSTPGSRTFCLPRSSTVSQSLSLPSPTTTSSLRTADGS